MGPPNAPTVVALDGVTVRYRRRVVLDGVSLAVDGGETVAVAGVNGSGKTTLLRLVAGLYRPNRGRRTGPRGAAYVPAALEPPAVTVERWIRSVPRPGRPDAGPVRAALEVLAFDGRLDGSCRSLSFGNLRKVVLAEALTSGASLLVVDEAGAGLDSRGIDGLAALAATATGAGAALVVADQGTRPRLPVDRLLVVGRGALRQAEVAGPVPAAARTVTVTLVGPAGQRDRLVSSAAGLGFSTVEPAP